MTNVPPAFDHYADDYAADPYPILADLRARCPVAHSPAHGGFYVATCFDDIDHLLHHPETFSNAKTSVPSEIGFGDVRIPPLQLDPPEHTPLRKVLNTAFTPTRISQLEPFVRDLVNDLIDGFIDAGSCDASEEFARLIPISVMCELFGLPPDHDRFIGWVRRLLELNVFDPADGFAAAAELMQFFYGLLMERRASPGADMISFFAAAEVEGQPLSDVDVVMTCSNILGAGIDTVWNTLASTLHHLATHPDDQERLRREPDLLSSAREEFLRAYSPVTSARVVAQDTTLNGTELHKGDMLLVSFPSANRDEYAFPAASVVVLDRQPNRHLAFGGGPHRCLGANLARLELTVALGEFLRRVPTFELDDKHSIEWTHGPMHGPRNLPIRFGA